MLFAVHPWLDQPFRRSYPPLRHPVRMSFLQRDHTHYLGLGIVRDPIQVLRLVVLELR